MDSKNGTETKRVSSHLPPMVAGAVATLIVTAVIYPLDTLKTRLQFAKGFQKAGGFRGVYQGFLVLISGTVPSNCIFYGLYEATKFYCEPLVAPQYVPIVHVFASSVCKLFSFVIRVPLEFAKQRQQAHLGPVTESAFKILMKAYKKDGIRRGIYRGLSSTIARDLPYKTIELPVWELLKSSVTSFNHGEITSIQSGLCGSLAGGLAGALTTPLDLAKTRIMLAHHRRGGLDRGSTLHVSTVLKHIYQRSGIRGLFAGITPRVIMIMIGGFIFFGVYEETKMYFTKYMNGN